MKKSIYLSLISLSILFISCSKSGNDTNQNNPTKNPNIYIVGSNSTSDAVLWKNGVTTTLAPNATANSIFVSGSDIYVAGKNSSGAVLWKNGTVNQLSSGGNANESSVYVSGSDVYVAGTSFVWKNGIVTTYPSGSNVRSVFVSGSDVYVAGYTFNNNLISAGMWKNGVLTTLAANASANFIYVSNNDVYVTGFSNNTHLWKNGVATTSSPIGTA